MRVVRDTAWIGVRDVYTEGRYQCAAGGMLTDYNNFATKSNSVSSYPCLLSKHKCDII